VQRTTSCACGQLRLQAEGDPIRVGCCSCRACQRQTSSALSVNSFFRREQVKVIQGISKEFVRYSDAGRWVRSHFCPDCGSTVYYEAEALPDEIGVPIGGFADSTFPAPTFMVFEETKHPWLLIPENAVAYPRGLR
jgi:hypothetical protein